MRDLPCGDRRIYLDVELRRVAFRGCGRVKQERLDFLADSPFYTKRFAFFVGRRCGASTIQDVARETHLNWKTVKALEMQYMREQLRRLGTPGPRAIGIDEISIRKGHTYRIVVSDLVRRRGSLGSEPRPVLRVAGAAEECAPSAGRDGYVESVRAVDAQECAEGEDSLR